MFVQSHQPKKSCSQTHSQCGSAIHKAWIPGVVIYRGPLMLTMYFTISKSSRVRENIRGEKVKIEVMGYF